MKRNNRAMKSYRVYVGRFLKAAREKAKLNQVEVSKIVGYTAQFLSNIERGVAPPPMHLMKELIDIYGLKEKQVVTFLVKQQELVLKSLFKNRKK